MTCVHVSFLIGFSKRIILHISRICLSHLHNGNSSRSRHRVAIKKKKNKPRILFHGITASAIYAVLEFYQQFILIGILMAFCLLPCLSILRFAFFEVYSFDPNASFLFVTFRKWDFWSMKVCGQNKFARLLPQGAITIHVLSAKPKNALFSLKPSGGTQTSLDFSAFL